MVVVDKVVPSFPESPLSSIVGGSAHCTCSWQERLPSARRSGPTLPREPSGARKSRVCEEALPLAGAGFMGVHGPCKQVNGVRPTALSIARGMGGGGRAAARRPAPYFPAGPAAALVRAAGQPPSPIDDHQCQAPALLSPRRVQTWAPAERLHRHRAAPGADLTTGPSREPDPRSRPCWPGVKSDCAHRGAWVRTRSHGCESKIHF